MTPTASLVVALILGITLLAVGTTYQRSVGGMVASGQHQGFDLFLASANEASSPHSDRSTGGRHNGDPRPLVRRHILTHGLPSESSRGADSGDLT
jgi:hypothetical protein